MKRTFLKSILSALVLVGLVSAGPLLAFESLQQSAPEMSVDINSADVEELTKLPGIGEKVAERIVAYREENGPFEKTEELMNVRGIGEKTYLKLEPFLTLGGEKDARARK